MGAGFFVKKEARGGRGKQRKGTIREGTRNLGDDLVSPPKLNPPIATSEIFEPAYRY